MYTTNYYIYLLVGLQLKELLFCDLRCINPNYGEIHLTMIHALMDLVPHYKSLSHIYLVFNNDADDSDLVQAFSNINIKFEVYGFSDLSVLKSHMPYHGALLVIIYESSDTTSLGFLNDSIWNYFPNILFVSNNIHASKNISYQTLEFKVLLPDPSKNQQAVLWQYTQGQKNDFGNLDSQCWMEVTERI